MTNLKKIYKKIYSKYYQNSISLYFTSCYKAIAKLNKVSISNILIGPGSDGIIRSVFETFVERMIKFWKLLHISNVWNILQDISGKNCRC